MSKVKVTADAAGNVISLTKNPEYGWVRVESETPVLNGKNIRFSRRSAIIFGLVEELKKMNFYKGQELPGKIVIKEGLDPINPNDLTQGIKMAGNADIPCLDDGQPIYRDSIYTEDPNETDQFHAHTNGEEIRAAIAALRSVEENQDAMIEQE